MWKFFVSENNGILIKGNFRVNNPKKGWIGIIINPKEEGGEERKTCVLVKENLGLGNLNFKKKFIFMISTTKYLII